MPLAIADAIPVAGRRTGRVPHPSLTTFPCVLAWLATRPSFTVVQIGANKGNTPEDPLYHFLRDELPSMDSAQQECSRVVLIEPVREYLDRLQIDAEGYDYRILQTIDFDCIRPSFVNYERVLLQEQHGLACREMMTHAGYSLTDWAEDTLCVRLR